MFPKQPPHIKVCCILSVDEAALAIACGASALGLVSAMPSGPGVIEDALIAEIADSVPPPVATFLLTCRQTADGIVEQQRRCRTGVVQLVDHVPHAELRRLRTALPGVKLVQVLHVIDASVLDEALALRGLVDALLLDSGNPMLAVKQLGGTGRVHDWRVSRRIRDAAGLPLFLAGGLHSGNVAEAISRVAPFGLDLCSSVRTEGRLDAKKLRGFFTAAKAGAKVAPALVEPPTPPSHSGDQP